MEEMKQTTVVMTAEEKAEFEAFQREKAKKAAEEKPRMTAKCTNRWWMRR